MQAPKLGIHSAHFRNPIPLCQLSNCPSPHSHAATLPHSPCRIYEKHSRNESDAIDPFATVESVRCHDLPPQNTRILLRCPGICLVHATADPEIGHRPERSESRLCYHVLEGAIYVATVVYLAKLIYRMRRNAGRSPPCQTRPDPGGAQSFRTIEVGRAITTSVLTTESSMARGRNRSRNLPIGKAKKATLMLTSANNFTWLSCLIAKDVLSARLSDVS